MGALRRNTTASPPHQSLWEDLRSSLPTCPAPPTKPLRAPRTTERTKETRRRRKMTEQQQQLHQQQHNGESQNDKKGLLNSRLVERALGYSWIKYGWDTASKTYETVKQSNSLAKYGCELAESNVHFFAPLIVIADEFSVRQLDKVEKGAELGQRLVQKVVVDSVSATYNAATSLP